MPADATAARDAIRRHAWGEAVATFREADRERPLEPDDLELYAAASWWSGEVDDAVEALERAFAGHIDRERHPEAAVVALRLAELAMMRMSASVAGGWMARAERLLEDTAECVAHAWLAFVRGMVAMLAQGDFERGEVWADESLRLARAHGSLDVESLALSLKGQVLLRTGRWAEGLALVDEAAAVATTDRLDPKNACDVYCLTISACTDIGAYRRAGEWIDKADGWMRRRAISGYRGVCRVHRAELKRIRGEWLEAEREAQEACVELERFRMLEGVGYAWYEVGEVRLRLGDFAAAEAAFERAYENGRIPQPGLALLLWARGRTGEAAASIASALDDDDGAGALLARDKLFRARLLAAQVEIALAVGDGGTAGAASDELGSIAASYDSDVLHAAAACARGVVALHDGAHDEAVVQLGRAWRTYQRIEMPYESARARVHLARARAAKGDDVIARLELRAAASAFERLGAAPDLEAVRALLDPDAGADAGADADAVSVVETKTFMFTDVVRSTDLVGVIGDEDWHRLIAWHDATVQRIVAAHGGTVVRHTGDGTFASFDRPEDAAACAAAIQRALHDHRRSSGFAPRVRIGLHTASAVRHGADYAGHGVHVAARVASLAERDQILLTRDLVDRLPADSAVERPRVETLKGVSEPVEVWSLTWREPARS